MSGSELLTSHKKLLEDFAEVNLRSYLTLLGTKEKLRAPKVFNDPVWHSILLYPFEIILLDSPLFQRLRRIRQLGVAHLVYPGASHSRFEHTIGTVHQVAQLAASINASSGDCLSIEQVHLLRIAGLCHDLGQGVMSHVSENALENSRDCESLKLAFADELGLERAKLSELAAYYLVGSPAFRELLSTARSVSADYDLPENAAEQIQKIIVGLPVLDQIPLLNELVAGPFDADKLDYMTRDAMMSGVPVVVDIPRLVLKARAVQVPQSDLPLAVAAKVRAGLPSYTFIGIDLSGGRTLDELMLARTLLFDKVYRHQKLRAAEAMVASIILRFLDLVRDEPAFMPYRFTDDELMNLDATKIVSIVGEKSSPEDLDKVSIICDLANRLRERKLLVRCLAFAETMPNDAYSSTQAHKQGLEKLLRAVSNAESCLDFAEEIAEETENIVRTLHKEALMADLPGGRLSPYVWISAPQAPTEGSDITRAYLIAGDREILPFRVEAAETRGWADAYILTRDMGYVFAPVEFSTYVFLAAEKLLRVKYGIHIPPLMMAYAKQDVIVVDDIKKALFNEDYYSALPRDIWPMPLRLTRADIDKRLEAVVARLAGYQGPDLGNLDSASTTTSTMRPDRVRDWLRQFEQDDIVEAALMALENTRLVGRREVMQILHGFLGERAEFRQGLLCTLGSPKDSSAVITYYAMDVVGAYPTRACYLEEALQTEKPIVFVDDFIGRGHQAVSILENWFDSEKTVDLGEERGSSLVEAQRELLRGRKLAFIFIAGWTDGKERLQKRCQELGLDAVVHVGIPEGDLPTAFSVGLFNSLDTPSPFQALCMDIGKQLMSGPGYDTTKAEERCLGYGNRANLVIFPYNTPTQALTCMWASGQYNGAAWVPLFPRRKKR